MKLTLNAAVLPVGSLLSQAGFRSRSPGRQGLGEEPLQHSSVLHHAAAHTDIHHRDRDRDKHQHPAAEGPWSEEPSVCGYSHCDEGRQHLQCVDVEDGQHQQLEVSVSR